MLPPKIDSCIDAREMVELNPIVDEEQPVNPNPE